MKIFSFISLLASLASVSALKPRDTTVGLFPFESIQLQESDLAALEPDVAALFNFANATTADASSARRSAQNCKVFPGDPEWPADYIWDIFNVLLGGALIKTVPIAAPCYSAWDYVSLNNTKDSSSADDYGTERRSLRVCNRQLDEF